MDIKGTTIVAVQKDGKCALAGDGQVTLGEATIMKHTARKVRRIYNDSVVVGFAGGVADAFTLCERFEAKLTMYGGSLRRAAVALAQDWRSDKVMRKLEALLICANAELPAVEIAEKALRIASGICVYTNSNIVTEEV